MSTKKMTFENKMTRLEEISNLMEESQISLDDSVKLYDEANNLIASLKKELSSARAKVKIVKETKDDEVVLENFEVGKE